MVFKKTSTPHVPHQSELIPKAPLIENARRFVTILILIAKSNIGNRTNIFHGHPLNMRIKVD